MHGEPEESGRDCVLVVDEYCPVWMLLTREYKYIHRYSYGPRELYHLTEDLDEKHNRYEDFAMAELAALHAREAFGRICQVCPALYRGSTLPVYGKA